MNLGHVMDEVAVALRQLTGLTAVFEHPPSRVTPPAAYVSYPLSVDYEQTYGQGNTEFRDLPIVFVSSRVIDLTSRNLMADWTSESGPQSVKAVLEAWRWQSCDDLTVTQCRFEPETIAGVEHLAAVFLATVSGPGKDPV